MKINKYTYVTFLPVCFAFGCSSAESIDAIGCFGSLNSPDESIRMEVSRRWEFTGNELPMLIASRNENEIFWIATGGRDAGLIDGEVSTGGRISEDPVIGLTTTATGYLAASRTQLFTISPEGNSLWSVTAKQLPFLSEEEYAGATVLGIASDGSENFAVLTSLQGSYVGVIASDDEQPEVSYKRIFDLPTVTSLHGLAFSGGALAVERGGVSRYWHITPEGARGLGALADASHSSGQNHDPSLGLRLRHAFSTELMEGWVLSLMVSPSSDRRRVILHSLMDPSAPRFVGDFSLPIGIVQSMEECYLLGAEERAGGRDVLRIRVY